jgi:protein-disulfide isomerase
VAETASKRIYEKNFMKKTFIIIFMISASLAFSQKTGSKKTASAGSTQHAQASAPPPMLLPSHAQIDAAMQRNFGYDPAVTWNILDVRESPIPGLADVILSINRQQTIHLYMSTDAQLAIVGNLLPFGPNPYEANREKLKAADGPSRGAQKPVIDVVEFSDLECPFCKAAQPLVEKLLTDFPQLRLTFQQFPLPATTHPWAIKAAHYADCAGTMNKDAFWKFIDTVFENQGSIALATADDKLKEFATASGLDAEKVAACAASPSTDERVNKSIKLGQLLDVNATPSIFVNGRLIAPLGNNGMNYEQLKTLVQFEIEHAGR